MRIGRLLGRIGFVVGFVGPVLFYSLQAPRIVCPPCLQITVPFATSLDWLERGLKFGLFQGLAFAVLGFAIGCAISGIRKLLKRI
jgi:hypothetical protein